MKNNDYKFIDLFAGIGGFRIALEKIGFKCIFSAEIDKHACEVYKANFGDNSYCDITELDPKTIPDFDLLCAGFPCQAFSISGKQKGFYDDTRGTLFFNICEILKEKKPKAFILENVKNLEKHDKGNTLRIMLDSLQKLGYTVNYKVLNARDFKSPQNRERIILVGNRDGIYFDFSKLKIYEHRPMKDFLDYDDEENFEYLDSEEYTLIENYKEQPKSGLIFIGYRNKKIRNVGVRPGTEHLSRVHKQPNRIYSSEGTHPTLSSQETSGRYWIYDGGVVRKLTQKECFRFMGFPDSFKKIGLKSKLYQRIGNSVCVTMIEEVGNQVIKQIFEKGDNNMGRTPNQLLEDVYRDAGKLKYSKLNKEQMNWVKNIVEKEEVAKGVFTALVSSLTYKILYPEQDIRYHKVNLPNGYSGRTFDTKYVTPFLKSKKFFGAMKESGWLTRSIEQPHAFTLDFPGNIKSVKAKEAFLNILNDIEENDADAREYLVNIFNKSIIEKSKKTVVLVNPVKSESTLNIEEIITLLKKHFYYKYSSRGASILPVIAFYSVYECLIKEIGRFNNKSLDELNSHTSCDRSSKATGDIVVRDKITGKIYEVAEIKFEIKPDKIMVEDAYEKFKQEPIQRYYILSTSHANEEEKNRIEKEIKKIKEEHGCQVIVNGVFQTLKYYLRLLENTDKFLNSYVINIQNNSELNSEHKIAWNKILQGN
ncbi:DNA (cytosine-5-)-methyltransferase [Fusobacterium sp.]|uniref:DNA (cytosine-5-)-methyltransferase n=1 Tax=Fusobacterium sp. TaxID=68766 RepID=UPI0026054693|nr:DNA (cytosine-5-)-methyltransferase [Fusobacterium sp.]